VLFVHGDRGICDFWGLRFQPIGNELPNGRDWQDSLINLPVQFGDRFPDRPAGEFSLGDLLKLLGNLQRLLVISQLGRFPALPTIDIAKTSVPVWAARFPSRLAMLLTTLVATSTGVQLFPLNVNLL
jgi:hypothetical protein